MNRFPTWPDRPIRTCRPPRLTLHTGVSTCRPKPPRRPAAGPALGRTGILLALALLATGCQNGLTARRTRLQPLVGQSLNTLIAIEGVPDRSFQANGVTYLSYVHQRIDLMAPVAPSRNALDLGLVPCASAGRGGARLRDHFHAERQRRAGLHLARQRLRLTGEPVHRSVAPRPGIGREPIGRGPAGLRLPRVACITILPTARCLGQTARRDARRRLPRSTGPTAR